MTREGLSWPQMQFFKYSHFYYVFSHLIFNISDFDMIVNCSYM